MQNITIFKLVVKAGYFDINILQEGKLTDYD